MNGPLAHDAEVFGGLDDAGAEEFIPHSVYGDPRGERIVGTNGPLCQSKPIARFGIRKRRQEVWSIGFDAVGASCVHAACQHVRIGERWLLPRNLSQISARRELVKLAIKRGYFTLNC